MWRTREPGPRDADSTPTGREWQGPARSFSAGARRWWLGSRCASNPGGSLTTTSRRRSRLARAPPSERSPSSWMHVGAVAAVSPGDSRSANSARRSRCNRRDSTAPPGHPAWASPRRAAALVPSPGFAGPATRRAESPWARSGPGPDGATGGVAACAPRTPAGPRLASPDRVTRRVARLPGGCELLVARSPCHPLPSSLACPRQPSSNSNRPANASRSK